MRNVSVTKACTNLSVFILVYFIAEEDVVTSVVTVVVVVVTVVVVTVQIRLQSSLSKDYKLQLQHHFEDIKLKCRSFERGKSIFRCCLFLSSRSNCFGAAKSHQQSRKPYYATEVPFKCNSREV